MLDPSLKKFLMAEGYTDLCVIEGKVCGCYRFIFTTGVCYGMDVLGYEGRFCFDTLANARLFLGEWNGVKQPVVDLDGCTAIK